MNTWKDRIKDSIQRRNLKNKESFDRELWKKKICVCIEENCAFTEKFAYVGMLDKLTVIHKGSLLNGPLCHHCETYPEVENRGESLHLWRMTANVFNNQSHGQSTMGDLPA